MLETRHHWLPIIIAVYLPVSFVITYSIAVGNDHVEPGFPYISDTGTRSPESCVFGQLLNIGAVIAGIIIYTRYRQSLFHFENSGRRYLLHLNTAAFIIGILTVFGVSLVGNFQETNVLVVHLLGAFLAFAVGFVYMVLQTIISCKSASFSIAGNTLNIRRFRIALCVADVILLILFVQKYLNSSKWELRHELQDQRGLALVNQNNTGPQRNLVSIMTLVAGSKGPGPGIEMYDWTAAHPGYAEHLVATISEWLVAFITVIYFATFYKEFKHFRMKAPEVIYYKEQQRAEISVIS